MQFLTLWTNWTFNLKSVNFYPFYKENMRFSMCLQKVIKRKPDVANVYMVHHLPTTEYVNLKLEPANQASAVIKPERAAGVTRDVIRHHQQTSCRGRRLCTQFTFTQLLKVNCWCCSSGSQRPEENPSGPVRAGWRQHKRCKVKFNTSGTKNNHWTVRLNNTGPIYIKTKL